MGVLETKQLSSYGTQVDFQAVYLVYFFCVTFPIVFTLQDGKLVTIQTAKKEGQKSTKVMMMITW